MFLVPCRGPGQSEGDVVGRGRDSCKLQHKNDAQKACRFGPAEGFAGKPRALQLLKLAEARLVVGDYLAKLVAKLPVRRCHLAREELRQEVRGVQSQVLAVEDVVVVYEPRERAGLAVILAREERERSPVVGADLPGKLQQAVRGHRVHRVCAPGDFLGNRRSVQPVEDFETIAVRGEAVEHVLARRNLRNPRGAVGERLDHGADDVLDAFGGQRYLLDSPALLCEVVPAPGVVGERLVRRRYEHARLRAHVAAVAQLGEALPDVQRNAPVLQHIAELVEQDGEALVSVFELAGRRKLLDNLDHVLLAEAEVFGRQELLERAFEGRQRRAVVGLQLLAKPRDGVVRLHLLKRLDEVGVEAQPVRASQLLLLPAIELPQGLLVLGVQNTFEVLSVGAAGVHD